MVILQGLVKNSEFRSSQAWLIPLMNLEQELLYCPCLGVVSHLIPSEKAVVFFLKIT